MKQVTYPIFELGPPCPENCGGVLTQCCTLKAPQEVFKKCSKCSKEFNRKLASEIISDFKRLLSRILEN